MASDPLPCSTPEAQDIPSSVILAFVDAAEKDDALHGFVLWRHGHLVAQGWWKPYGLEIPHQLYSRSKSFTSTAIGLAIEEGRLGLDDMVLFLCNGHGDAADLFQYPEVGPQTVLPDLVPVAVAYSSSPS